jgi:hypothetical protein
MPTYEPPVSASQARPQCVQVRCAIQVYLPRPLLHHASSNQSGAVPPKLATTKASTHQGAVMPACDRVAAAITPAAQPVDLCASCEAIIEMRGRASAPLQGVCGIRPLILRIICIIRYQNNKVYTEAWSLRLDVKRAAYLLWFAALLCARALVGSAPVFLFRYPCAFSRPPEGFSKRSDDLRRRELRLFDEQNRCREQAP